ncbi:MAG: SusC/RagA family TonB-linked outer membrane protein [Bacteroidota bacterium]
MSLSLTETKAQSMEVSGKVHEDSVGLPGVSVMIKGMNEGTVTNGDGEFNVKVPSPNSVLIFTFVGYATQEVEVNSRNYIEVSLQPDIISLSQVVVTALGLSREKKSLGYSTQEVKGSDLVQTVESNFVSNLSGKVAGVNIISGGAVGSTSRITIRGESVLGIGSNSPLFVVDGVPIDNGVRGQGIGGADYGNATAEIDPNNIKSINVLKGPAAAALYGSRAAKGAIIITTKNGQGKKGIGIEYSGSISFSTPLVLPKFQNQFGQGRNGVLFQGSNFGYSGGPNNFPDGVSDDYDESWGARFDPSILVPQFNSPTTNGYRGGDVYVPSRGVVMPTPWVADPDNMKDFFEVGRTTVNTLALSGSSDKATYRVSYNRMDEKGIVPNNNINRNTISLNLSVNPTEKLTTNVAASYVRTESPNRPVQGYGRNSLMYQFTWLTRNVNMESLRDYWQPGLSGLRQFQYNYGENHNNPFFFQYENTNDQLKNHLFGNVSVNYQITPSISVMARTGTDVYDDFRRVKRAFSTVDDPLGRYEEYHIGFRETNSDVLVTYDNYKTSDASLTFKASVGTNRMDQENSATSAIAPQLTIPGIYSLGNAASPIQASNFISRKRINSVYGLAQVAYDDKIFLDVTGRNDWSSTLPSNNNSYFYPSVSLSALWSEIVKLPDFVSYGKIRSSWAQVGNDTNPYELQNAYVYQQPWQGALSLSTADILANPQLKPELSNTYEFGLEFGLFDKRLEMEAVYYDIRTKDQIIPLDLSISTGYDQRRINAGEIRNHGVEILLKAAPLRSPSGFNWNASVNFAKNINEIVSLTPGLDAYVRSFPGEDAVIEARPGGSLGDIYGPAFERVPDGPLKGMIIVGSNGRPLKTTENVYLGNYNPDWTAGVKNTFSFKGFSLSTLFDIRYGGIIISRFVNKAIGAGQLIETLEGRGARPAGEEYSAKFYHDGAVLMPDGSYERNLTIFDGTLSQGIYGTDARSYFKSYYDHNSEAQRYDASFVKLREVNLSYTLPDGIFKKLPLYDVTLSLFGRNLYMWTENQHFDPETGAATQGTLVPGFENMSYPSFKSYGFNLSLKF